MFAEALELDRWGYGRTLDAEHEGRRSLVHARRAQRACPNGAISFTVVEDMAVGVLTSGLPLSLSTVRP